MIRYVGANNHLTELANTIFGETANKLLSAKRLLEHSNRRFNEHLPVFKKQENETQNMKPGQLVIANEDNTLGRITGTQKRNYGMVCVFDLKAQSGE